MTVQDYAAAALEKSAEDLIKAAQALPEDKREWRPLDKGRSALSQLAECAVMTTLAAKIVRAAAYQDSLMAEWDALLTTVDTPEHAMTMLHEGTATLAHAVRAAADADLDAAIELPWATMTLAQFFLLPLWNMSYHEGQITYIETLL